MLLMLTKRTISSSARHSQCSLEPRWRWPRASIPRSTSKSLWRNWNWRTTRLTTWSSGRRVWIPWSKTWGGWQWPRCTLWARWTSIPSTIREIYCRHKRMAWRSGTRPLASSSSTPSLYSSTWEKEGAKQCHAKEEIQNNNIFSGLPGRGPQGSTSAMCWNCRGIGTISTVKELSTLMQRYAPTILCARHRYTNLNNRE